jgi:uncharacterized SAM-binding protein YcdF (DUF218 family)
MKAVVRRLALVAAAVALVGAVYVARVSLLVGLGSLLTIDTAGPRADFIVPLGGGADTRPFVAADLYRDGVAPSVVIFEHATTEAGALGIVPSETELYRRVLEIEGVPPSAIRVAPGRVDSTWAEAEAIGQVLPRDRATSLVIVTSPEHTRRAFWTFRQALADWPVDVRMAPARHRRFDETNWWRDDEGTLLYLHELLKLPYYWARYAL